MSTNVQASSSSYGLAVTTLVCSLQLGPSITTAKHRAWHLSCNTNTPPSGTWMTGGASTLDQLQNGDRCRRHIRWKLDTTLHHLHLPAIHTGLGPSLEGVTGWPISILWLGAERDVHAEQRHHALEAMTSISEQRWSLIWPFWTSTTDNGECSYPLWRWNHKCRQHWRQLLQISDCLHLLPADRVRSDDFRH